METNDETFMLATERRFIKFLTTTVKGIKLDYLRKQNLKGEREILLDYPERLIDTKHNYNEEFGCLDNEDILDALETLTEKERTIVHMAIIDDLPEHVVAEKTNISQQGVNKAKKRALGKMKNHILTLGGGGRG